MSNVYFKTDLQVSATALATSVAMSMIDLFSKFLAMFLSVGCL